MLIEVGIDVDAPPDQVWHHLESIERHVEWMTDAAAIRFVGPQTSGVGTRFECDTKVGPITLVDRMEITAWEPEEAMGVRHDGAVTGTGLFRLHGIDPGADGTPRRTHFTWAEELHFPWWLGGRLGELLGGRLVMRAIWRRNLRGLRRLVERD